MGWLGFIALWPLYPRDRDSILIFQGDEWTPGPVWMGAEELAPTGIRSPYRSVLGKSPYLLCYPLATTTRNQCHENLERYESGYSKENQSFTSNSTSDGQFGLP
jgi:hypothetical protein